MEIGLGPGQKVARPNSAKKSNLTFPIFKNRGLNFLEIFRKFLFSKVAYAATFEKFELSLSFQSPAKRRTLSFEVELHARLWKWLTVCYFQSSPTRRALKIKAQLYAGLWKIAHSGEESEVGERA